MKAAWLQQWRAKVRIPVFCQSSGCPCDFEKDPWFLRVANYNMKTVILSGILYFSCVCKVWTLMNMKAILVLEVIRKSLDFLFSTILLNLFFSLPYFHSTYTMEPSSGLLFPTSSSVWIKTMIIKTAPQIWSKQMLPRFSKMLSNAYFIFSLLIWCSWDYKSEHRGSYRTCTDSWRNCWEAAASNVCSLVEMFFWRCMAWNNLWRFKVL